MSVDSLNLTAFRRTNSGVKWCEAALRRKIYTALFTGARIYAALLAGTGIDAALLALQAPKFTALFEAPGIKFCAPFALDLRQRAMGR